jgi:type II secretory pathway pseudopilin PulG
MGLLLFALVIVVGSLPIAIYQLLGARRWQREQRETAPARFAEAQSGRRRASTLGTAYARTTKFIG